MLLALLLDGLLSNDISCAKEDACSCTLRSHGPALEECTGYNDKQVDELADARIVDNSLVRFEPGRHLSSIQARSNEGFLSGFSLASLFCTVGVVRRRRSWVKKEGSGEVVSRAPP